MFRYRHLLITLGVVALLLVNFDAAAAKDDDYPKLPYGGASQMPAGKGKPAHLIWTPGRVTQTVTAGQTLKVTATFSSSVDIDGAILVIPGQLGKLMKPDSAKLTSIKAGTPTTITFTVTMPVNAHSQGGVVQVRLGGRTLARPLPVLLTVANGSNTIQDEDDTAKPVKPVKPAKPAKKPK